MQTTQIENIVRDEANERTYVVLASKTLSDGEVYRAIRQEIHRRGGVPVARGATLTLTLTASGSRASCSVAPPAGSDPEPGDQGSKRDQAKPDEPT